jgi:hypothetical protein
MAMNYDLGCDGDTQFMPKRDLHLADKPGLDNKNIITIGQKARGTCPNPQ